jgi:hypothetical protein
MRYGYFSQHWIAEGYIDDEMFGNLASGGDGSVRTWHKFSLISRAASLQILPFALLFAGEASVVPQRELQVHT